MEWGILVVLLLLLFTGFVIVQETFRQLHWRGLVAQGDVDAIRQLIESEIQAWKTARVPRGTPAQVWHGVQTVELLDVTPDAARVSCDAEGEYTIAAGRRIETSSPLSEGMKVTKRLAEMLLYDIPNVKLDRVQIDVYTSFRDESGAAEPRCILSTLVSRSAVGDIDWDETEAADFIALTGGRFAAGSNGVRPIEPMAWPAETARSG